MCPGRTAARASLPQVTPVRDDRGITTDFVRRGDFPCFGNDDDRVDAIACEMTDNFYRELKRTPAYRGAQHTVCPLRPLPSGSAPSVVEDCFLQPLCQSLCQSPCVSLPTPPTLTEFIRVADTAGEGCGCNTSCIGSGVPLLCSGFSSCGTMVRSVVRSPPPPPLSTSGAPRGGTRRKGTDGEKGQQDQNEEGAEEGEKGQQQGEEP